MLETLIDKKSQREVVGRTNRENRTQESELIFSLNY